MTDDAILGLHGAFVRPGGSEWFNGDARPVSNILSDDVRGEVDVIGIAHRGA